MNLEKIKTFVKTPSKERNQFLTLIIIVLAIPAIILTTNFLNRNKIPAPANWVSFMSTGKNFSVMMPNKPTTSGPGSGKNSNGPYYTYLYSSQNLTTNPVAYSVSTITYKQSAKLPTLNDILQYTSGTNSKVKVINLKYSTINGLSAENFEYSINYNGNTAIATGVSILKGNTVYSAVSSALDSQAPYTKYFISNFRVY